MSKLLTTIVVTALNIIGFLIAGSGVFASVMNLAGSLNFRMSEGPYIDGLVMGLYGLLLGTFIFFISNFILHLPVRKKDINGQWVKLTLYLFLLVGIFSLIIGCWLPIVFLGHTPYIFNQQKISMLFWVTFFQLILALFTFWFAVCGLKKLKAK